MAATALKKPTLSHGKIEIKIMDITPLMARKWLENNKDNRPLSKHTTERYTGAIKRGEWEFNGESIKFGEDEKLLDGQHRLYAISRSEMTVSTLVVTGLPNRIFHTLDTGLGRRASDVFHIRGEKNVNVLSAVLRIIFKFDEGNGNLGRDSWRLKGGITIAQLEQTLENHPDIRESVKKVNQLESAQLNFLRTGGCAAIHYLFTKADKTKAFEFFEKLGQGYGLQKDNPILTLRNLLLASQHSSSYLRTSTTLAVCIKAWNAYYEGKKCPTLTYDRKEEFPLIAGLKKFKK